MAREFEVPSPHYGRCFHRIQDFQANFVYPYWIEAGHVVGLFVLPATLHIPIDTTLNSLYP